MPSRFDRLLVVLLLACAAAHLAFVLLPHRPEPVREWAGNPLFFPPFVISAVLALRAAARHPAQRASWRWFGGGQLAWATGQIMYTHLDLVQLTSPYPSIADAFFLTLIPCFIVGLLFNRSPVPGIKGLFWPSTPSLSSVPWRALTGRWRLAGPECVRQRISSAIRARRFCCAGAGDAQPPPSAGERPDP